ncbi:MAG: hypothetical protein WD426_05215 [Anditalea sp.]
MKKIYFLLLMIGALGFQACEGPMGPPGIDGMDGENGVDGEDGGVFLSTVLETGVNFSAENNYQAAFGFEIFEDDNLLVYRAIGADEEENVAWMPLPQTVYAEEGVVIYNYYFTRNFFSIFLETSVPDGELASEWIENQYFRIVVVPGQFLEEAGRVDYGDFNAVMKWLGKEERDIERIDPK